MRIHYHTNYKGTRLSYGMFVSGLGIGMLIMSGGSALYYTTNCAWSVYYLVFACSTALPWANCHNPWNTDSCVNSVEALTQPFAEGKPRLQS